MRFLDQKIGGSPFLGMTPLKNLDPALIMESAEDKVLNQSVVGFRLQYFVFQSLVAKTYDCLQSIGIGRAAQAYQCLQGHDMSQGIAGLYRTYLGSLRPGHQPFLEALHRMFQGLCVLHKTLIANARCEHLSQSATRSGLVRLHHCPYGTPKWVKTRLAASLRQGLMVILSAKSSHA